jgi:hypothetical protein
MTEIRHRACAGSSGNQPFFPETIHCKKHQWILQDINCEYGDRNNLQDEKRKSQNPRSVHGVSISRSELLNESQIHDASEKISGDHLTERISLDSAMNREQQLQAAFLNARSQGREAFRSILA